MVYNNAKCNLTKEDIERESKLKASNQQEQRFFRTSADKTYRHNIRKGRPIGKHKKTTNKII